MSASATPISPARFAAALPDLPLSSLYAKGAEIRNSVAHLEISNDELHSFDNGEDTDFKEAIHENLEVIGRMNERLELLRKEVENRGFKWEEQTWLADSNEGEKADSDIAMADPNDNEFREDNGSTPRAPARSPGGSLGDEELARMLGGRMDDDEEDEEGIHL